MIEAAKNANIHEFIEQLPQVYIHEFLFHMNSIVLKTRAMKHVSVPKVVNYRVVKSKNNLT